MIKIILLGCSIVATIAIGAWLTMVTMWMRTFDTAKLYE